MSTSGLSGAVLAAVDSFRPSLVARSTGHQALLIGASGTIGYCVAAAARKGLKVAGMRNELLTGRASDAALFAVATAASAPIIVRRTKQEQAAHADWGGPPMNAPMAVVQGTAVTVGVVGGGILIHDAVDRLADRVGGPRVAWHVAGGAAGIAALAVAAGPTKRALFGRLSITGSTADHAFRQPPTNPLVSGGPATLVPYDTHAREGSRFVQLTCSQQRIEELTGRLAKGPIRVFVGVSAAPTPADRVRLAVQELERLGAFHRRYLLAVSPAGTGYANPVPVEALELLSGGDCATVVVQYGVLPSMFSTGFLPDAEDTFRLLIDALIGRGPQVLCFGESLGAEAAQHALSDRWKEDGSYEGVDAALFVGTPAGTGIRRQGAAERPAVLLLDRWEDLPSVVPDRIRVFLLDHDADPVTRFEAPLIWRRPDWLKTEPRGRGIPPDMAWRPLLTYLQVLFDVARATQPQLGQFQSHGHDYRADLARVIRAAFVPGASEEVVAAVEKELVASELRRADLLSQH